MTNKFTESAEIKLSELKQAAERFKLREIAAQMKQKMLDYFTGIDIEEMRADMGREIENLLKHNDNRHGKTTQRTESKSGKDTD